MARPAPTLEQLRARHDHPQAPHHVRSAMRYHARKLAAREGIDVPTWAAQLAPTPPGCRPSMPAPAGAPVDVAALDALREWRERTPGAVVQVSPAGVALHMVGETRRYPNVLAALAAMSES